ncbi:BTB/POZ domain-containing protein 17 [Oleoguttula sp. CCFEE 5521]
MAASPAAEMHTYFNDQELSDIKIKFGDQEIFAHRYVLCRKPAYFRTMLTGEFAQEKGKPTIELHENHPASVLAMLRFIYGLPYMLPTEGEVEECAWLPHARVHVLRRSLA